MCANNKQTISFAGVDANIIIFIVIVLGVNGAKEYRNVSWTANQHITMISEGSCDTEDWSNNAENTALPTQE